MPGFFPGCMNPQENSCFLLSPGLVKSKVRSYQASTLSQPPGCDTGNSSWFYFHLPIIFSAFGRKTSLQSRGGVFSLFVIKSSLDLVLLSKERSLRDYSVPSSRFTDENLTKWLLSIMHPVSGEDRIRTHVSCFLAWFFFIFSVLTSETIGIWLFSLKA